MIWLWYLTFVLLWMDQLRHSNVNSSMLNVSRNFLFSCSYIILSQLIVMLQSEANQTRPENELAVITLIKICLHIFYGSIAFEIWYINLPLRFENSNIGESGKNHWRWMQNVQKMQVKQFSFIQGAGPWHLALFRNVVPE